MRSLKPCLKQRKTKEPDNIMYAYSERTTQITSFQKPVIIYVEESAQHGNTFSRRFFYRRCQQTELECEGNINEWRIFNIYVCQ